MMVDTLANVLAAIKNGSMRGLESIKVPTSKFIQSNLKLLEREGYIGAVSGMEKTEGKAGLFTTIQLLYRGNIPIFKGSKKISKCSLRVHGDVEKISSLQHASPQKLYVVSTNKGVMSANEATERNIGGEILYSTSMDRRKMSNDDFAI